jgi:hypothetical protein
VPPVVEGERRAADGPLVDSPVHLSIASADVPVMAPAGERRDLSLGRRPRLRATQPLPLNGSRPWAEPDLLDLVWRPSPVAGAALTRPGSTPPGSTARVPAVPGMSCSSTPACYLRGRPSQRRRERPAAVKSQDHGHGIVAPVIMVKNGARILGPAGIVLGLFARSWAVVLLSVFIILMSGALWYTDNKKGWITNPGGRRPS